VQIPGVFVVPKIHGLSVKQKLFVQEYLVDLNATEAALRAGYSPKSASAIGKENLQNPPIAKAIDAAIKNRVEKIEVSQEAVVQELANIAFANVEDVAEWDGEKVTVLDSKTRSKTVLSAVSQVSNTPNGVTLRMHDKQAALVNLGKHLGMFRERQILEVRDGTEIVNRLFDRLDEYAERVESG
jgi:phage terminase small subunit